MTTLTNDITIASHVIPCFRMRCIQVGKEDACHPGEKVVEQ